MTEPGLEALLTAPAVAVGVRRAGDVLDVLDQRTFLHAGPPLDGREPVGPMRGAIAGALLLEGEAADLAEAGAIVDAGGVALRSCHDNGAVGAMAGIVSPSIPVLVVEGADGERVCAPLNEGLGSALRFGATAPAVIDRLRWMGDVLAPVLDRAIQTAGGVDIVALQAEGLRRGDECHNRNVASTAALLLLLAPHVVRAANDQPTAAEVLAFIGGNPHTFLTFSMAAGKAIGDAAHRAGDPGLVTAISANGHELGLRVSGVDGWVTSPAPLGTPKLFDGYTAADANPMMGDSFMTETIGIGAFALSAAPAISSFIGGTQEEAVAHVAAMRTICRATSGRFLLPLEGFVGTPVGIDVSLVAQTGTTPVVNNGFAHREAGRGQVGAGLTVLPMGPFAAAANALGQ
jgi:hypothetical protein